MTVAWSRHGMTLAWRADEFGKPERDIYLGSIYVGGVWHYPVSVLPFTNEYQPREKPWRAWFMNEADGSEVGWFATEQEARDALVDAVLKALFE